MNDQLVTLSTHRFGSFICRQMIDLNTDSVIFMVEQSITSSEIQNHQKPVVNNKGSTEYFGWGVALSADSDKAYVRKYGDNDNEALDRVFTCNNGVWKQKSKLAEITYKGAIVLDNVVVGNVKQNNHGTMAFMLTTQLTICHKPFTLTLPFPESVSQYLEQNQTSVELLSASPHYNAPKDQIVFTTSISTLCHECYIEAEVILAGFLLTLLTSVH